MPPQLFLLCNYLKEFSFKLWRKRFRDACSVRKKILWTDDILVFNFDANMERSGLKLIHRKFETFLESGEKAACYVEDDRLHLIYNVNDGVARLGAEYAVVDLKDNKIVHRSEIERNDLVRGAAAETDAVVWQNGKALIPITNSNDIKNGNTVFQVLSLKK